MFNHIFGLTTADICFLQSLHTWDSICKVKTIVQKFAPQFCFQTLKFVDTTFLNARTRRKSLNRQMNCKAERLSGPFYTLQ